MTKLHIGPVPDWVSAKADAYADIYTRSYPVLDPEELESNAYDEVVIAAPAQNEARRYLIALGLKALKADGNLIVTAAKTAGGSRLAKEIEALGLEGATDSRNHAKTVTATKTSALNTEIADIWLAQGELQLLPESDIWTQPGIFCWDRIDPGTEMLLSHLQKLSGRGADVGCGLGLLSIISLENNPDITKITLCDNDRRAIKAARDNLEEAHEKTNFIWHDALLPHADLKDLDFVIINPPFHFEGVEDKALGQKLLIRVADMLKRNGKALIVANRHLPYETILAQHYREIKVLEENRGYKILEARK